MYMGVFSYALYAFFPHDFRLSLLIFLHFPFLPSSYSSSPSSLYSTQLLERCAVGDFTIKDLTAPTAKRFQANLSGILNFYFFEQDQGDRVLRPLEDEVEHLAAEEEGLITENAELRERIEQEKCVFPPFPSFLFFLLVLIEDVATGSNEHRTNA
jgi:hypothetical protein